MKTARAERLQAAVLLPAHIQRDSRRKNETETQMRRRDSREHSQTVRAKKKTHGWKEKETRTVEEQRATAERATHNL